MCLVAFSAPQVHSWIVIGEVQIVIVWGRLCSLHRQPQQKKKPCDTLFFFQDMYYLALELTTQPESHSYLAILSIVTDIRSKLIKCPTQLIYEGHNDSVMYQAGWEPYQEWPIFPYRKGALSKYRAFVPLSRDAWSWFAFQVASPCLGSRWLQYRPTSWENLTKYHF